VPSSSSGQSNIAVPPLNAGPKSVTAGPATPAGSVTARQLGRDPSPAKQPAIKLALTFDAPMHAIALLAYSA